MRDKNSIITVFTYAAGAHYVAFRLSLIGFVVELAQDDKANWRLSVTHESGRAAVSLRAITSIGAARFYPATPECSRWQWHLRETDAVAAGDSAFCAFVDLKHPYPYEPEPPDVFIVPSKDVAEHIWHAGLGPYQGPLFCIMEPEKQNYFEAWHRIADYIEQRLPASGPAAEPPGLK